MAAAPNQDPLRGALLGGRYRVATRIAAGATSTVYRGLDERLDRPVALKVMDARYAGDRQFLTRFELEARTVAKLNDSALVAVYDHGAEILRGACRPYLVLELVEGGTLRALLDERGPMPPHAVAAVLRPVLGALSVAHRAGLVHRDIKPENILIASGGEVKVADFGLLRATTTTEIATTSATVGTVAYLAPEQVRGDAASPASDVYAVGVLCYELLTGHTPFTGDSVLAVACQRLDRDVPPPSSAIEGVPSQFDDLVAHATARDPSRRYPDAAAMGTELAAIADRLALPAFRVPAPHNRILHPAGPTRAEHPTVHKTLRLSRESLEEFGHQPNPENSTTPDSSMTTARFAGIGFDEFTYRRRQGRRMTLIWLAIVCAATGLVAAIGWTLGSNVSGLL